jgi:hypothetical protein
MPALLIGHTTQDADVFNNLVLLLIKTNMKMF